MDRNFKVAVVGPHAAGKTTLLASVFTDTQKRLASTSLTVRMDGPTKVRVDKHSKTLAAAITREEFNPKALEGTQSIEHFHFSLRSLGDAELEVPFDILDYPGGWLDAATRQRAGVTDKRWAQCEEHIANSIMLMVPIDAAVLMEARTPTQRAAAQHWLGIHEVVEMAGVWGRFRNLPDHREEPALVMLVPIKCEKYLDPARGAGTDASALRERVREVYADLLETLAEEFAHRSLRLIYAPVETYGCVRLVDGEWDAGEREDFPKFTGTYRFTGNPPKIAVRGTEVIVRELCGSVLEGQKLVKAAQEAAQRGSQQALLKAVSQPRGFWGALSYRFSGERREDLQNAGAAGAAADMAQRNRNQLEADLAWLAHAPQRSSRSEEWKVAK
ncbi:hypothetical protein OG900_10110 [Streptomyces sp. NBC_00433]